MKDYKEKLSRYKFTDELGHPLENCQDFIDLLAEPREAVKAEREACARIAETPITGQPHTEIMRGRMEAANTIAKNIRARNDEKAV